MEILGLKDTSKTADSRDEFYSRLDTDVKKSAAQDNKSLKKNPDSSLGSKMMENQKV